jgi:hypothetical protein
MIVKTYSVFCDGRGPTCHTWIAQNTDNSEGARRDAKKAGWVRKGGKDYCPECKP